MDNIIILRDRIKPPVPPTNPAFQGVISAIEIAVEFRGAKTVASMCRSNALALERVMREVDRGHYQSQDLITYMAGRDIEPDEVDQFVAYLRAKAIQLEHSYS
jgi:hypothetical protein